jgi:hypothetical protein
MRWGAGGAVALIALAFAAPYARASEPLPPSFAFQPAALAATLMDLSNVRFSKFVEQDGRYVKMSALGAALGLSRPIAFGLTPCIHVDRWANRHFGILLSLGLGVLGNGVPSDAGAADLFNTGPGAIGMTVFGVAGPEVQSPVLAQHVVVRGGLGVGARYLSVGGASLGAFILQARASTDYVWRSGASIGAFVAWDAVGETGRTLTFGISFGPSGR